MGFVRLFESERKDAITPNVRPPIPFMARNPPNIAIQTYSKFPRFIITGIRILANLLAFVVFSRSSRFFSSKPSFDLSSWQKTFITF